jgi:hypothetical protein
MEHNDLVEDTCVRCGDAFFSELLYDDIEIASAYRSRLFPDVCDYCLTDEEQDMEDMLY